MSPNISKPPWAHTAFPIASALFYPLLFIQSIACLLFFFLNWGQNSTTSVSGIPSLLPRAFPFHYRLTLTDPPPPSQGPGVRFPYSLGTLAEKRSHPYCQQVWATSFRQIFTYVHAIFHCQIFLSVCGGGKSWGALYQTDFSSTTDFSMAAILLLAAAHERIPGTCSIPDNLHATEMERSSTVERRKWKLTAGYNSRSLAQTKPHLSATSVFSFIKIYQIGVCWRRKGKDILFEYLTSLWSNDFSIYWTAPNYTTPYCLHLNVLSSVPISVIYPQAQKSHKWDLGTCSSAQGKHTQSTHEGILEGLHSKCTFIKPPDLRQNSLLAPTELHLRLDWVLPP